MNEKIQIARLKNGIPLLNIKSDESYSVCSVWFKCGSVNDPEDKNGIAHLLEHLYGIKTKQNKNIFKKYQLLESNGIYSSAETSYDLTKYYNIQQTENFYKSFNILVDSINNSYIDEKFLETEKKTVLNELSETKNNLYNNNYASIHKNLFKNSPLEKNVLGNKNSLKNIQLEDIKNFQKQFYTLENTIFITSSDKDISEIKKYLDGKTINIQHGESLTNKVYNTNVKHSYNINKNIKNCLVSISYKTCPISETDNTIILDSIKNYLCSGYISILVKKFRIEKPICYYPEAITEYYKKTGLISFIFECDKKYKDVVIKIVIEEIEKVKSSKIENLNDHKTIFISKLKTQFLNPESIFIDYGWQYCTTNKIVSIEKYISRINNITKKDMADIAKKYFIDKNLLIGTIS